MKAAAPLRCETCGNALATEVEKLWNRCEGCLDCRFPRKPTSELGLMLRGLGWDAA